METKLASELMAGHTRHVTEGNPAETRDLRRDRPEVASFVDLSLSFMRIIQYMKMNQGKIIIHAGSQVWPHELKTAEALASAGFDVEFPPKDEIDHRHSADALINDVLFEMKAPKSSHLSVVDKNIKKALSQSSNIVFDSRRMKSARDDQVRRELEKSISQRRKIRSLLFVDKKRAVHRLR